MFRVRSRLYYTSVAGVIISVMEKRIPQKTTLKRQKKPQVIVAWNFRTYLVIFLKSDDKYFVVREHTYIF